MSISNPTLEHPCKKFIDFKGDSGKFFYYDKEKKVQVEIPLPIYFVVLDELTTITGYSKKNDCGIYANEVHRTADELLRVKTFEGNDELVGLYKDIKDSIKAMGGKYTKSVYALMMYSNGSSEMVNFKLKGASFSGWLEKKFNTQSAVVGVKELKKAKNGSIDYTIPVFKKFKLEDEWLHRAIAADEILQDYFNEYFKKAPQKGTEKIVVSPENPLTDAPQANDKWMKGGKPADDYHNSEQYKADLEEFDAHAGDNPDDLPF